MAQIAIEFLIILIILGMVTLWGIWFFLTTWIYKKRYKPENDKGRKAEEARRAAIPGNERTGEGKVEELPAPGSDEPSEQRGVLQTEPVGSSGEDSKRSRGFFGRFRKRK